VVAPLLQRQDQFTSAAAMSIPDEEPYYFHTVPNSDTHTTPSLLTILERFWSDIDPQGRGNERPCDVANSVSFLLFSE